MHFTLISPILRLYMSMHCNAQVLKGPSTDLRSTHKAAEVETKFGTVSSVARQGPLKNATLMTLLSLCWKVDVVKDMELQYGNYRFQILTINRD